MKKILLSVVVFMTALSFNACSDSEMNRSNPVVGAESQTHSANIDFGKTIPVSMIKEDGLIKVGFMISAQFYTLKNTAENKQSINLIEKAIQRETPIHVYLKPNSTEIANIEHITPAEARSFKSMLTKRSNERSRGAVGTLESVIPDQATLIDLFKQIKSQSCGSSTSSRECINFGYPVDGCYARAHKMREILMRNGYDCEKQFVYGNLKASNGSCCVSWNYHVAILVSYRNASGNIEKRIIDPSLFPNRPVTDQEWRDACTNSSCGGTSVSSYANTPGDVYYRSRSGFQKYDDDSVNTNCVLTIFSGLSGCYPSPAPSVRRCDY
ncbi:hypothetical protein GNY06_07195 [Elizabethkingia argentiflava]|uniref:Protein glutaminase domain-containing protein n=1 Tax=Elizabethkingia argenteiflava TaxID=2681556 RepID=A0A845PSD1_9FLAO|nr:protein-glutamine glutaminase [Elizabethkingia argenteiflava]NAW51169.1 hypothetical protein [Elizabethkingia argenteiflava]